MSTTERDAQREDVRARIVEAARDIVGEEGLDALSMRALALRIGHSPGTIYQYFQGKDELLRSVMEEGFKRLGAAMTSELESLDDAEGPRDRLAAMGRGYARFALENTGYFRAMFKTPGVAQMEGCPGGADSEVPIPEVASEAKSVELLCGAVAAGEVAVADPERAAVVGWGLIHGLTSLYLGGHLRDRVSSHDEFMDLIESAMEAIGQGWQPREGVGGTDA